MNQDYKSRFSQMRDNNPTGPGQEPNASNAGVEQYGTESHTRNLGFAWPDGRRLFLNYSYLVSGEFTPDNGSVTLAFTTHIVTLKGLRLADLYEDLMGHIPRVITCAEARYNSLSGSSQPVVNEMVVNPA